MNVEPGKCLKIATVTASYNEPHKLNAWHENYLTYAHDVDLHIIVDDNSSPEYLQSVKEKFPASVILRHNQNRGLIAALNTGFHYAIEQGVEYIVTMLPDMRLAPGCLLEMQAALEADPKLGLVCPVLLQGGSEAIIEEAGGEFDRRKVAALKNEVGQVWQEGWQDVKEVGFVSGGLHMVRRKVFEQVGLQDERLFMYCDELDFDWRVRQAGYSGGVVRHARAWHEHIYSNGKRPPWTTYLWSRNRMLIMRWHGGRLEFAMLAVARFVILFASMFGWARRDGWAYAGAHLKGFIHGLWGIDGPPAELRQKRAR